MVNGRYTMKRKQRFASAAGKKKFIEQKFSHLSATRLLFFLVSERTDECMNDVLVRLLMMMT